MKKYLLSMMSIMMMALVSASFVACGDDDDNDNNGGASSASSGTSKADMGDLYIETNHCYWDYNDSINPKAYNVQFCNIDVESYLKAGRSYRNADVVDLDIIVDNGDKAALPTGTFSNFTLSILRGVNSNGSAKDVTCYVCKSDSNNQAKVTISRDGDIYTFNVTGISVYLMKDLDDLELVKEGASFSYTGRAQNYAELKDEYKDVEQEEEEVEEKDSTNYSTTMTVDYKTFTFDQGYWYKYVDSTLNETYFHVNLFNCPYTDLWVNDELDKLPSEIHELSLYFEAQGTSFDGLPEANFVLSSISLIAVDTKKYLEEIEKESTEQDAANYITHEFLTLTNSRHFVSIKKDGDKFYLSFSDLEFYKINVGGITIIDDDPLVVKNWGYAGQLKDINYLYNYDDEYEEEGDEPAGVRMAKKVDVKNMFFKPMFKR